MAVGRKEPPMALLRPRSSGHSGYLFQGARLTRTGSCAIPKSLSFFRGSGLNPNVRRRAGAIPGPPYPPIRKQAPEIVPSFCPEGNPAQRAIEGPALSVWCTRCLPAWVGHLGLWPGSPGISLGTGCGCGSGKQSSPRYRQLGPHLPLALPSLLPL